MVYQVAICDDEKSYVEFIKNILTECYPQRLEYNCYYSGDALLEADMQIHHPLIILDIQIGALNGTEVAKRIRKYNEKAVLVFCSGIYNPTPETFLMAPYRFIQKQNPVGETKRFLKDAVEKMMKDCEAMLAVDCGGKQYRIDFCDVIYIDKSKYTRIVHLHSEAKHRIGKGPAVTLLSFEELMSRYEKYGLAYPHNSYLVNMRYVSCYDKETITLKDGTILNIARSKAKEFSKRLNEYWGSKY